MEIQRLRNLTTGRLHTEMSHIYEDLGNITGEQGLMTHMLPRAMRAVEPWLRENVTDLRFWDGKYDTTHTGEIDLPTPTQADRDLMFERYAAQPNPLANPQAGASELNTLLARLEEFSANIHQTAMMPFTGDEERLAFESCKSELDEIIKEFKEC